MGSMDTSSLMETRIRSGIVECGSPTTSDSSLFLNYSFTRFFSCSYSPLRYFLVWIVKIVTSSVEENRLMYVEDVLSPTDAMNSTTSHYIALHCIIYSGFSNC